MNNEEKIIQLLTAMQEDISGLKEDVSGLKADVSALQADVSSLKVRTAHMERDIAELKEGQEEVRVSVNRLVGWADECGYVVKFPLPKL